MFIIFLIRYSYYRYGRGGGGRPVTLQEFLIGVAIMFIIFLLASIWAYLKWNEMKLSKFFQYFKPLSEEQMSILEDFKYYRNLSPNDKKKFEKRVRYFIINKEFINDNSDEVSEEMKVLIAASCAQLTLGYKPTFLSFFKTIRVFNDSINSKIVRAKSEIWISWGEFREGFAISDDAYNPGIEVIAAALSMENKLSGNISYTFGKTPYRVWKQKSRQLAKAFVNSGQSVFKNINDVDEDKYFGVSVVYFFEKPEDFKKRFPELYHCMSKMLKQDPLKVKR